LKVEEYIKSIEKTCGEPHEYIVVLKYEKQREVLQKIASKSEIIGTIVGVLGKLKYEDKEIRVVGDKVLIKNVKSIGEVKKLFQKLLV
jgi:rRNA processing protein Gar1